MDRIIQTIAFGTAVAFAAIGAAKAGAPLGPGQNNGGPTLVSVLKRILPAVIDIEARGRVVQAGNAPSKARRKVGLFSKVSTLAASREVYASGSGVVMMAGPGSLSPTITSSAMPNV
jgi:hypothetical protein